MTPTGKGKWRLTWQEMAIVVTHSGYDVPSREEINTGVQYSIFLGPLSIWATRWKLWISVNGDLHLQPSLSGDHVTESPEVCLRSSQIPSN